MSNIIQDADFKFNTLYEPQDLGLLDNVMENINGGNTTNISTLGRRYSTKSTSPRISPNTNTRR